MDLMVEASPRRVYANAHTYHINSISVNSDNETYLSADDLRVNLWHLDFTDRSFSILFVHLFIVIVCCPRFFSICYFPWIKSSAKWINVFISLSLNHWLLSDIVDIKPANMEELTEVITASEFHPLQCNTFVYGSSKGTVRLCDMRASALCDQHSKCK